MSRQNLVWILVVPILVFAGMVISFAAPVRDRDKDYKLIRTMVDVLAEIDQNYVRELSDKEREQLVEDMINLGLNRLDRYSQYLNAEEYKQFENQTEGNFSGIGVSIGVDPKTGLFTVISPLPGTPAAEAGLRPGDVILKVDNTPTDNLNISDLVKLIQGEVGTTVKITLLHEGAKETTTYTIKRARIETFSVFGFLRNPENPTEFNWYADAETKMGYVRISQFTDKTADELKKVLNQFEKEQSRALIVDLRDNPGGLLNKCIEICDFFLPGGEIVSTKDRNQKGRSWSAKNDRSYWENPAIPIAVLVNRQSASASEIVAAALQDNHRATIIGERTWGKGSVQRVIRLTSDPPTALKLTTDTYWRPSGKNIHRHNNMDDNAEWGVKPNDGFEIVLKDDERVAYAKYRRNLDILAKDKPKEEKTFTDRALEKAITYLKTQLNK